MQDKKYGFIIFCNLSEFTLDSSSNSLELTLDEKVEIVVRADAPGGGIVCLESETSYSNISLKETKLIKIISKGYHTSEEAFEIGENVLTTLKLLGVKQK